MREKKNVDSILKDLCDHLNAINELFFDYKWSTKSDAEYVPGTYTVNKYGKCKDLNEFLDDINHAIINLETYRSNEKRGN